LTHFVNRLDSDLSKEADFFKTGVGKVASLAPVIDESKKEFAKLKTKDGKAFEIPILTGKFCFLFKRNHWRETFGYTIFI